VKKRRNVFLAVFTLLTVFAWVALEIWQTYNTSTITPDVEKAITPLNPTINNKIFSQLSNRSLGD